VQQTETDWGGSTEESLSAELAMQVQIVDEEDCKPDQQGASLSRGLDFRPLSVEPHLRRRGGRHFTASAAAVHSSFCVQGKQEYHGCGKHDQ
jgi:hypothetical protein